MPGGGPAGVHAADRRDLGAGQPGRGRWPTCWRRPPSGRPPCSGSLGGLRDPGRGRRLGRLVGAGAGWCVAWIVEVARARCRRCRPPAVGVGERPGGARPADRALRRGRGGRRRGCCGAGRPGWPAAACWSPPSWSGCRRPAGRPTGWLLVACDVGQGDGLVLNTGLRAHGGRGRRRPRPAADGPLPRPASASAGSRWWCSPTSTPTTSTASPGVLDGRQVAPSR